MNLEFRKDILLSAQKSLCGAIYPEVRAVAIGYKSKKLKVIYYLDREPNEEDFEIISIVTTEIIADFPDNTFKEIIENCIHTDKLIKDLDFLDGFVYVRKE